MFRTHSPALVEAIVNHPDVRPTIEDGMYRLNASMIFESDDNLVFACETGVVIFVCFGDGVYHLHGGFLAHGRGANAVAEVKNAIEVVFSRYAARKVQAAVPLQLRAARMFCRLVGFASEGRDLTHEHFALEGAN